MIHPGKHTEPMQKDLQEFCETVVYRRFSRWPRVGDADVAEFLARELSGYRDANRLLEISDNGRVVAVLAFRELDYDTRHYGFVCLGIDYLLYDHSLDTDNAILVIHRLLDRFRQDCRANGTAFVSVSIDSGDGLANAALQKHGFRSILTWIDGFFTRHEKYTDCKRNEQFGLIRPEEMEFFKTVAAQSYFTGGRFYLDGNFDRDRVNQMYSSLVESSYDNGDILLVYRINDRPAGLYIYKKIEKYPAPNNLSVAAGRFLVVDPNLRGKNIGHDLFVQTLLYFRDKCDLITTGLEVHNLPSLNLHTKLGFVFNYTHNVYHWWAGEQNPGAK